MYGTSPREFEEVIAKHVKGRHVVDLGCGNGERTEILHKLGAKSVIGVDKDDFIAHGRRRTEHVLFVQRSFTQYDAPIRHEVVHIAWPWSNPGSEESKALVHIISQASTVVYVGKNTDGTVCGVPELFWHFAHREVLEYVPRRDNTLIVYGPVGELRRAVHLEEHAGIYAYVNDHPVRFSATGELFATSYPNAVLDAYVRGELP